VSSFQVTALNTSLELLVRSMRELEEVTSSNNAAAR
jgi:hypothetical protein